jgi:hypothetical protein
MFLNLSVGVPSKGLLIEDSCGYYQVLSAKAVKEVNGIYRAAAAKIPEPARYVDKQNDDRKTLSYRRSLI